MTLPNQRTFLTGVLLAVLATIIWAGNFIIARGVIKTIPPVSLAFYRWLLATLILLPFAWKAFSLEFPVIRKRFLYFLFTAITGVSVFNTLVYIAGHYSPAVNLALIGTTTSPVFATILAVIFLKESLTPFRIIGMLICISGVLLLLSNGNINNLVTLSFTEGDLWVLGAAFSFAIYNTLVRRKPPQMKPVHFLFIIFLMGTIILLPFYLVELSSEGSFEANLVNISVILYLGLGTSVIAFLFWNSAIMKIGVSRTALFGNLVPVFSAIEAVLFLNEEITWIQVWSFVVIIAGLIIANLNKIRT